MKSSMNQNNMKLPTLVETMRDLYGFMGIKIEHQTDGQARKLDDYAFEMHVPHYFEEEIIEQNQRMQEYQDQIMAQNMLVKQAQAGEQINNEEVENAG